MQVKLFTIPLFDNETELNEMNGFLRAQKVLTIDKQFVSVGEYRRNATASTSWYAPR